MMAKHAMSQETPTITCVIADLTQYRLCLEQYIGMLVTQQRRGDTVSHMNV